MYTLTHDGEKIGVTNLERGDPATHSVSGAFENIGGAKAMAGWIKSVDGQEDDGVVYIALNEDFALVDQTGHAIQFREGNLIAVPEDNEVFLDITGLSEEDYKTYFAEHISALNKDK